ncbi:hypothetical protein CIL03_05775 [Virgibacillus indicus]|uniref:Uncharacterized protein n=1 Tax=Virgibacillus indicus TaxID=2024554 RepID=A0A265NBM5_9BACI|nr:hypothetical protein [Virgibacillus indicus]OZU89227.1 hypothetical protein CIL03_05775 [Virgibacillus indicus]
MTKNIRAYFKTENDAESARANLQKLRVSNVFIDEFPEEERESEFVPILPLGTAGTGTGVTGAGIASGVADEVSMSSDSFLEDDRNDNHVTHLLEGQVEDEDYKEALQILADNNGYDSNSY